MSVLLRRVPWNVLVRAGAPAADLADFLARPGAARSLLDLALVAAAGGLVVVPAFAAVQAWSGAERRARGVCSAGVNVEAQRSAADVDTDASHPDPWVERLVVGGGSGTALWYVCM